MDQQIKANRSLIYELILYKYRKDKSVSKAAQTSRKLVVNQSTIIAIKSWTKFTDDNDIKNAL